MSHTLLVNSFFFCFSFAEWQAVQQTPFWTEWLKFWRRRQLYKIIIFLSILFFLLFINNNNGGMSSFVFFFQQIFWFESSRIVSKYGRRTRDNIQNNM